MQGSRPSVSATKSRILQRMLAQMAEIEHEAVIGRIVQKRREAGLTQPEVADLLDINLRTYQDYESHRVPWRRIEQLAEVLGTSKRWLLYGDEQPTPAPSNELAERYISVMEELTAEIARLRRRLDDSEGGAATP